MISLTNLKKLWKIAGLKKNWNGYQADPIPRLVIFRTLLVLILAPDHIEIFPTAAGTISIEDFPYSFEIDIDKSVADVYGYDGGQKQINGVFSIPEIINEVKKLSR